MSQRTSPYTKRLYGVERVCNVWHVPRSTFYHHRQNEKVVEPAKPKLKRGPKPEIADDALLKAIKDDLDASPFQGEGYRKVWARLKVLKSIHVGSKRVLRIMRENQLLSPYRTRKGIPNEHTGTITTDAPNVMWGTDGVRILTVEEGWVWLFTAVEHWNAECVGWHVCKVGDRFAALEPIAMGLQSIYGSVSAGIARGLSIRMDHGTQYLSDHFLNQLQYWGAAASYAFVQQPQTNGVAERFNRTLKEQAVHGRIFKNIQEVRCAVDEFVVKYNSSWMMQKLDYLSPHQARDKAGLRKAA